MSKRKKGRIFFKKKRNKKQAKNVHEKNKQKNKMKQIKKDEKNGTRFRFSSHREQQYTVSDFQ